MQVFAVSYWKLRLHTKSHYYLFQQYSKMRKEASFAHMPELSSSYTTYQEFSSEFHTILFKEAWKLDGI